METEIKSFKVVFGGILTILSIQLKLLAPLVFGYTLLVAIDMFMGIRATSYESKKYPLIPYKVSSTAIVEGLYKKIERIAIIFASIVMDYLIAYAFGEMNVSFEIFGMDVAQHPIIAILVTVSFIGSELISIVENYCRMGNEPPTILGSLGEAIKEGAKSKGDRYVSKLIDLTKNRENDKEKFKDE